MHKQKKKGVLQRLIERTSYYRDIRTKLARAESDLTYEQAANTRLRHVQADLDIRIAKITDKLCGVAVQRDQTGCRLRVTIELDRSVLDVAFLHGGDQRVIERIGDQIGLRAAQLIQQANFSRYD